MPGYEGKVRFTPPGPDGSDPVPLKAIVFLDRSAACTAPVLRPIAAGHGLMAATDQLIRFNPNDRSRREVAATFERLAAISGVTPCYRLEYPAGFTALPQVAAELDALLGQ
jgi:hypothetical protein